MREIVLDTETTGIDPKDGHRIVEIGGVELVNRMPTGRVYHQYINPERAVPRDAVEVHGLDNAFLADKPVFNDIARDFVAFVGDAKLVIHNAAFDMRFLNAELSLHGLTELPDAQAIDTLALARRRFPGSGHSLDALCRRFGIDNSAREKHGALLDAELLSEVYIDLLGLRQQGLSLEAVPVASDGGSAEAGRIGAPKGASSRAEAERCGAGGPSRLHHRDGRRGPVAGP